MPITAGSVVRIEFELKVKGGELIESSKKTGFVEYTHGAGQMLAGLEKELAGMSSGEERSGVIPAKDAFGTEESQPTLTLPRGSFPADAKIKEGERFEANGPTGTPMMLRVLKVDGENVTARVIHPLAGKDVEFRVKVLQIKPPVPKKVEELDVEPDSKI
jgi:FKBP-type peptidyl-prolyl cis-trans isomerase 2